MQQGHWLLCEWLTLVLCHNYEWPLDNCVGGRAVVLNWMTIIVDNKSAIIVHVSIIICKICIQSVVNSLKPESIAHWNIALALTLGHLWEEDQG